MEAMLRSSTSVLQSSSHFWNELTEDASTTIAGSLLHTLTILRRKNPLLDCGLHLFTGTFNYHLWPLAYSACPPPLSNSKKTTTQTLSKPIFNIIFYRAYCSVCIARYCFTNSVCLSVCLSIRPMPVLCLNQWTYRHTFLTSRERHSSFFDVHCRYRIPRGTPKRGR